MKRNKTLFLCAAALLILAGCTTANAQEAPFSALGYGINETCHEDHEHNKSCYNRQYCNENHRHNSRCCNGIRGNRHNNSRRHHRGFCHN